MKTKNSVRGLATAGLIAALYTALALIAAPIAFGPIQCRPAEALCVLAAFSPAAVAGLTAGCALTNVIGLTMGANVAGALDVLVGTLATGAAAWLSHGLRNQRVWGLPFAATLPPVVVNALVIGTELALVAPQPTLAFWLTQVGLVAAGQVVACVGGGLLVARACRLSGLENRL